MNTCKRLRALIIFLIIAVWIFSGWPRIWQKPPIPPKIQEAQAASPQVLSITPSAFNTNATSHAVAMPATVEAGDLLLALISNDGGDAVTTPSGWAALFSAVPPADTVSVRFGAYAKVAIGNEDGTTVNFVTSGTEMMAAQVYRIQAGTWDGELTGIEVGTPADGGATGSTTPNPPSLTPSWGALDTLWIACYGADDDDAASGYPTSYTNGTYTPSGTAYGSCSLGSARRELNGTSDDPSNFTIAATEEWVANTIAIRPAAVVYSVSVEPTSVGYGVMAMGATKASGIITATVGDTATKLNIRGADATYTEAGKCTDGVCTWTLDETVPIEPGTDIYVHAFTKNTGLTTGGTLGSDPATQWVALTKSEQLLAASVAASGSQTFKLDMRTPSSAGTETNLGSQYSTEVTIVASAP